MSIQETLIKEQNIPNILHIPPGYRSTSIKQKIHEPRKARFTTTEILLHIVRGYTKLNMGKGKIERVGFIMHAHLCAHTKSWKQVHMRKWFSQQRKQAWVYHAFRNHLSLLGTPSLDNVLLSFSSNWAKELLSGSKNQVSS